LVEFNSWIISWKASVAAVKRIAGCRTNKEGVSK
jgi:hypothetical protein